MSLVPETKLQRPAGTLLAERLHEALAKARCRTLALVADVSDEDLNRVHDPLMSPLVWDLGHIAAFEDLWLAQRTGSSSLSPPSTRRSAVPCRPPETPAARSGSRQGRSRSVTPASSSPTIGS